MTQKGNLSKKELFILIIVSIILFIYFIFSALFALIFPLSFSDVSPGPITLTLKFIMQCNPFIVLYYTIAMIVKRVNAHDNSAYRYVGLAFAPVIIFILTSIFFPSFNN